MDKITLNKEAVTAQIPATLPQGYLAHGYTLMDGHADIRYILDFAQEIAAALAPMKKSLFLELYRKIDCVHGLGIDFELQLLAVVKLIPVVAHLVDTGRAPQILLDFCKKNATQITSRREFVDFRNHMEAIYCFMH